jgi:hypothetical protein
VRGKNAICLKESRESNFWLRVADAKRLGSDRHRKYLLNESGQLVAIDATAVCTLQDKLRR